MRKKKQIILCYVESIYTYKWSKKRSDIRHFPTEKGFLSHRKFENHQKQPDI